MVKRAYENLPVHVWRHRDPLRSLSHSLCLFHNRVDDGRPILEALQELESGKAPAKLTLTFAANSRQRAVEKLTLLYAAQSDDLKVMNIAFSLPSATIRVTKPGLLVLINAITAWLGGAEDFRAGSDQSYFAGKELGALDRESPEIWFWGPGYIGP